MVTITRWTGRQARILREVALRMTIYEFAAHTNLSTSTIRDMENKGEQAQLRTSTQKILDETLAAAPEHAQQRFAAALAALADTTDPTDDTATTATTGQIVTAPATADLVPSGTTYPSPTGTGPAHSGPADIRPDIDVFRQADGESWTRRLVTGLAADVRSAVEKSFDDGLPYVERLERLQESSHKHAVQVAVLAPGEMISCLAPDLVAAYHMLRYARTHADAVLLRSVLAKVSAIVADELSVLGNIEPSRAWYKTAIAAADRSQSTRLQAAVRALAAMLPLYHGRQADVVQIAQQARQLAGTVGCFATSLASMFEALARARLGDHDQARQALRDAQIAHDRMGGAERAESFFGLSVRRRLFYEGRVLTTVGDYAAADAAHRQARELYPPQVVGDPAIMDLDRATALISLDEPEAGADLIVTTLSNLPADHQAGIFLSLATRTFDSIPVTARKLPAPRACAELLDALLDGR